MTLFKLFGFPIRVDASWLLLFVLITWSLAGSLFPALYPDLSGDVMLVMGIAGALGLFGSIILHELAHALVARRHAMRMSGITLFLFGGVAEMTTEPPDARAEFRVAVAGPIASVVLAAACLGLGGLVQVLSGPAPVVAVLEYLGGINAILVAFNVLPAFPLDGGRVLRSLLWRWKQDLRWATRVSSEVGSGFGTALIIVGVVVFLGGGVVGGMWWVLIGLFLRGAARMSFQQLLVRRALEGEAVDRFMSTNPDTVPADISVEELVHDHIYQRHHQMFPVTDNGSLYGAVSTQDVRDLPREQWREKRVEDIARPIDELATVQPDTDAVAALSRMNSEGQSRLLVVEQRHLRGILTLKDLMKFIALKVELDAEAPQPGLVASAAASYRQSEA